MLVNTNDEVGFPGKNKTIFDFSQIYLNGLPGFRSNPLILRLNLPKLISSMLFPVPPITIVISQLFFWISL